jgi:polar amino acid transport system substrate-binding protein
MKRLFWVPLTLLLVACLTVPACSTSSKIIVATDATYPPFESVNETTKAVEGFDIDLMKAVAEKAGLDIQFKNVAFDPLLTGMAQGTYDIAISAITITEDRSKSMSFSDAYFNAGQLVVVQISNTAIKSKNDLTGKKVGVQLGTTGQFEVEKITGVTEIKKYDEIGLAYQALMNGQVEAVVADNPVALNYVAKNATKLKAAGDVFTNEFYGIAVNKKKPDLLAKINQGLAAVKADGLIPQLTDKWIKS